MWETMLGAEIILGQLLDKLGVVEDDWGGLLRLLHGDSLGASTAAQVGARLLRLAQGLIDDAPLEYAAGLHSSHARQNLQDLFMAGGRDLAIQIQLVHGEFRVYGFMDCGERVARPWSERGIEYRYAIPLGQLAEKVRGVDKAACC
jgi:hypothetical protein